MGQLKNIMRTAALVAAVFTTNVYASGDAVNIDASSFKCMADMEKIRHFYVDNLLGNLDATLAVAKAKRVSTR